MWYKLILPSSIFINITLCLIFNDCIVFQKLQVKNNEYKLFPVFLITSNALSSVLCLFLCIFIGVSLEEEITINGIDWSMGMLYILESVDRCTMTSDSQKSQNWHGIQETYFHMCQMYIWRIRKWLGLNYWCVDNTQEYNYIPYSCFGRLGSLNESHPLGFQTRRKKNLMDVKKFMLNLSSASYISHGLGSIFSHRTTPGPPKKFLHDFYTGLLLWPQKKVYLSTH